jgi:electron-transferring-flavoprotein dehydrogenase
MALTGKYTLFAEGCRGHLGKRLIAHFNLAEGRDPQSYSIGIKELWDIDPAKHKPGLVMHTAGWPVTNDVYGGSFLYHCENNQVAVGYVVGLGYANPFLNPFEEFQRYKHHPQVRAVPGRRAPRRLRCAGDRHRRRAGFAEAGLPGRRLIGDDAGFLNVPKIKGSHAAIKTGMLGAEAAFAALGRAAQHDELAAYPKAYEAPGCTTSLARAQLQALDEQGPADRHADGRHGSEAVRRQGALDAARAQDRAQKTKPAAQCKRIDYPKPDSKLPSTGSPRCSCRAPTTRRTSRST